MGEKRVEISKERYIENMVKILQTQPWWIIQLLNDTLNHIKV